MAFRSKPRNRRHSRGHVLNVKLSSSQRRGNRIRRFTWGIAGFLLLFGIIYGGWRGVDAIIEHWVYNNDAFAITQLELETDGVLSPEQLRSWAGVRPKSNLMRLDLGRVKRDLEMVPAIETVAIERVLPGTLRIHVSEREPIAQVNLVRPEGAAGGRYTVDARGYFMFPIEPVQRATPPALTNDCLPVLLGVPLPDVRAGRQSELPQVHAALELIQAFNRSSLVGMVDVKHVDVSRHGVLVMSTLQGNEITFGIGDFDLQLRRWRTVQDHASRIGRHLATLDLAVGNNSPMQWVDAAAVSTPPARPPKPSPYKRKHV